MDYAYTISPTWFSNPTGFLHGDGAEVTPENPYRIPTYIPKYYSEEWRPIAQGNMYPSYWPSISESWNGTNGTNTNSGVYISQLINYKGDRCLNTCSMGGCDDPTSAVYAQCKDIGCCECIYPYSSQNGKCVIDTETSQYVILPSETGYTSNNCFKPEEFCSSELSYFNCSPYSTLTAETDPVCEKSRPRVVPW